MNNRSNSASHAASTPGILRVRLNLILLLVLLLLLFILLEVLLSSDTELSAGNYGRYLDVLWANDILGHGSIRSSPFPSEPSLFSNANSYSFNLLPAMTLVTSHVLTGTGVTTVQVAPLYGIGFFVSVLLLASALYGNRQLAVICALLLTFFFVYTNNGIAREVNRIVLAYFVLNMFFYSFIKSQQTGSLTFRMLSIFLLIYFIFTYSSDAVTGSILILGFTFFEARRIRRFSSLNLAAGYVVTCLLYYLLVTDFISSGIQGFMRVFEEKGFTFSFTLFTRPGIWPSGFAYVPRYTLIDWGLLVYPFLVLGFLLVVAVMPRWKRLLRLAPSSSYDSLLFAFLLFIAAVVAINSWALIPTAGLDYIALVGWLAPVLVVSPLVELLFPSVTPTVTTSDMRKRPRNLLERYRSSARSRPGHRWRVDVGIAILGIVLVLGIGSILHYNTLPTRQGEVVTQPEISASAWLSQQNLTVVSDLHFLSTYVTIDGTASHHYLPLSTDTVEQVFYDVNLTLLRKEGVNAYVVTETMESLYMTHFDGTRTVPNPQLGATIASQWSEVYDDGYAQVYVGG